MYHYCTYFNIGYLVRGLALYRSLMEHHVDPFVLWVLCFDDQTFQALSALNQPNLRPIALEDFERGDDALLAAKQDRTLVEYYFTCSPSWPLYLMNTFPEIDLITYLDADLLFFADSKPIFAELGDQSILIIPHRFPKHLEFLKEHGIYNVGMLSFRNDANGRACLEWWRARCLEWCYDRVENGKFADQKYLDDWPTRFKGVVVLQYKGANLAPWNWMSYRIHKENGRIMVDDHPLIFYHFQGIKMLRAWLYDLGLIDYGAMPLLVQRRLYIPYILALRNAELWASRYITNSSLTDASVRRYPFRWKRFMKALLRGQVIVNFR